MLYRLRQWFWAGLDLIFDTSPIDSGGTSPHEGSSRANFSLEFNQLTFHSANIAVFTRDVPLNWWSWSQKSGLAPLKKPIQHFAMKLICDLLTLSHLLWLRTLIVMGGVHWAWVMYGIHKPALQGCGLPVILPAYSRQDWYKSIIRTAYMAFLS